MSRFNHGMIFTNDNCVGCNKCISGCPVIGANISLLQNGKNRIEVDERRCIHCGHCLNVCTHNAREYLDDTGRFLADLTAGEAISLAVAPSFYLLYPDEAAAVLGYLQTLGVKHIYDVGFGADIATWCHLQYIEAHRDTAGQCPAYISHACPTIVNYAECCAPELLELLVPVQSPVICLGIYVHGYLHDSSKIAFLSPCITKKDEIESPMTGGNINYNITYRHLFQYLETVDWQGHYAESELKPLGLGGLFPLPGGFKEYVDHFTAPDEVVLRIENVCQRHEEIKRQISNFQQEGYHPLLIDMLNCEHGCLAGPAANQSEYDIARITLGYRQIRTEQTKDALAEDKNFSEKKRLINETFARLNFADFKRSFTDRYRQPFSIPESTYDEIFMAMHKDSELLRHLDCRSCGYASCRDMVTAVANGYNRMENCIHYANEEITRLYYTDSLTGIPNGAAFLRNTAELLRSNPETVYVIDTIDINEFKVINDLYDFSGGNKVLQFFAQLAVDFTRNIGTCARSDTDHFVLCFPYTTEYMNRLQACDFYDCSHLNIDSPLTVRHGLYIIEDSTQPVNRMLDLAAIAQSNEKDRGRNTYSFYNEDLRQKLLLEANITAQMREALQRGEFVAYLQPQFNHSSGALVGAEVLCRWLKADGSIVSPAVFIPIFEKNGFIRNLDCYMWEAAFKLLRRWLDSGIIPVPISTNISRISLQDSEIAGVFADLQKKYAVSPELLHLEITESAYMQNQKQIIDLANQLRGQGFLIAMDDFGSGYSSLNTLKDVPIDILKLDMGFFSGESNVDKGGNIISSMIRMAQGLKLTTIAEGVEEIKQADFLKSIGCDIIQGYLYAKPMPVEQFEFLLREEHLQQNLERPRIMEQIDINSFYNPASTETKMFNNYTGAAIVFEYEQGEMFIIRINDKYLRELGLDKEYFEDIRVKFLSTLLPESRQALTEAIEYAITSGQEAVCLTQRQVGEEQEPIWIKSHLWCVAANGECYTLYGLAENVSAEKNSEQKLLRINQQMELFLENSPAGLFLFSSSTAQESGGKDRKLTPITVNRYFCEWTGYTKEEVLNWTAKEALKIIHPQDRLRFSVKLHQALETTLTFTHVYRARRKNGEYHWVRMVATAVPEQDAAFWVVANITDHEVKI